MAVETNRFNDWQGCLTKGTEIKYRFAFLTLTVKPPVKQDFFKRIFLDGNTAYSLKEADKGALKQNM